MNILSIGELLLRLTVPDNIRFTHAEHLRMNFGCSEANVSIALAQLGWKAGLISAVPDNDLGKNVTGRLRHLEVDTTNIHRIGDRMGLYFLEEGNSIRSSRIIYDRTNSAFNKLRPTDVDWTATLKDVTHLHWSAITPSLSENAARLCHAAVNEAAERGIIISCDLHSRKNQWSYGMDPKEVIPPMLRKSNVVVGDPSTISSLTGIPMISAELKNIQNAYELAHDYRLLMDYYPSVQHVSMLLRTVVNSNHHTLKGVLISRDEALESRTVDLVNLVDRIGGGDAYMAGVIHGLFNYNDQEALEFALTLSALKHTIRGDYFIGTKDEVEEVLNTNQLGKIIR